MASQKLIKEKNLHDLLEGIVIAQRHDIVAYSGGHLNEANLFKPPKQTSYKATWKSATKPIPQLLPKSQLPPSKHAGWKEDKMKTMFTSFSIGTGAPSPSAREPKARHQSRSDLSYSKLDDGILVEEIKLADTMLPRIEREKTKPYATEDLKTEPSYCKTPVVAQSQLKEDNLANLSKHQFLPSHLEAVTKRDQFNKLKDFESGVLRKQDTTEQHVLTGVKAVEHLEAKLRQDLDHLPYDGYGPNFHRLQLYSNTCDDLIKDSPTFGFIVKTIKKEYDSYISHLLERKSVKHNVLYDQVEKLASHGTSDPRLLHQETSKVHSMEKQAREQLLENERLRKEVQKEIELASQPEPEVPKKSATHREEPDLELTDQIEQLRTQILEKMDAMKDLRKKLRTDFVPSTVVQHLEQCIKETEVEIQKLTSSKDFFERSIAEMETDLRNAIESADTTERDARRVWKKVSAVKSQLRMAGGGMRGGGKRLSPSEDSDDEDDEIKWSWYIS